MLNVSVKITGDADVIRKLGKLGNSLLSFQMAMRSIGQELSSYYSNQVFASQGAVIGKRWPLLSDSTKKYKSKLYPGTGPLVRTGTMKRSFDAEYPDVNSVTLLNKAPYFIYHQSSAPRTKLPRRVMMSTGGDVKTIISDIIDADMRTKIARAGL